MLKHLILAVCLFVVGCGSQAVSAEYNIQVRRDTAARWASFNPVLKAGELACEQSAAPPYNCEAVKVGNGTQTWSSLPYLIGPTVTASGVYSPTVPLTTNTSSTTPYAIQWTRAGDVVTVNGILGVWVTAADTATTAYITLPVPTGADFSAMGVCAGTKSGVAGSAGSVGGGTTGGSSAAVLTWRPVANGLQSVSFSFSYNVVP